MEFYRFVGIGAEMKVGDIHWVELPNVGGREQAGRRPAIILQDDGYASS